MINVPADRWGYTLPLSVDRRRKPTWNRTCNRQQKTRAGSQNETPSHSRATTAVVVLNFSLFHLQEQPIRLQLWPPSLLRL